MAFELNLPKRNMLTFPKLLSIHSLCNQLSQHVLFQKLDHFIEKIKFYTFDSFVVARDNFLLHNLTRIVFLISGKYENFNIFAVYIFECSGANLDCIESHKHAHLWAWTLLRLATLKMYCIVGICTYLKIRACTMRWDCAAWSRGK